MAISNDTNPNTSVSEYRLLSYLSIHLRWYALHWKEKLRQRSERELVILNARVSDDNSDGPELIERLSLETPSAEDVFLFDASINDQITSQSIYRALENLTSRQRQVLLAVVVANERQEEVAKRLGITQQAVQRIKERALQRLRSALEAREE